MLEENKTYANLHHMNNKATALSSDGPSTVKAHKESRRRDALKILCTGLQEQLPENVLQYVCFLIYILNFTTVEPELTEAAAYCP